jgi:hypothetical protein
VKTSINLTVWARGERIKSCVHFGKCLDVSFGASGFSICPVNPINPPDPSPIDPIPIDVYQFDPRRSVKGRPKAKKLIERAHAPLKKKVRFSSKGPLEFRVDGLSNCAGTEPEPSDPPPPVGTCCITCNGVTACGCAVEMPDCGVSCCVDECC